MNDRYLFRAKRIDNGEWVEGYYVRGLDMYENEVHLIFEPTTMFYSHGETDGFVEVDPSTICQCTGLKDKNGKMIWENDIVKATVRQNSLCQSSTYSDFYQVAYHEKYCYFYLKKKNNNLLFDGNWSYYIKSIEVIGNIFDNPELMYE